MKHIIILSIILLSACQKEAVPTLSERIEGVWRQEFSPHSIYSFSDGLCIQRIIAAETEVYRNEFAYACTGDTMYLVDLVERTERRWIIDFTTDSTARIETGGFVLNLKRGP